MRYRITCLTPTLIGDGQKLSPIDYMVWKDHVNVLDQRRIFKLLSKGPRLDGYLAQLKKADRLDFAAWGGFAQNFAGRRIPFENVNAIPHWEKAHPENLFIPTFAVSPAGPYIPGTAIKGALRTGAVADRWTEGSMRDLSERLTSEDRLPRLPALRAEEAVLVGLHQGRIVALGDRPARGVARGRLFGRVDRIRIVAEGVDDGNRAARGAVGDAEAADEDACVGAAGVGPCRRRGDHVHTRAECVQHIVAAAE